MAAADGETQLSTKTPIFFGWTRRNPAQGSARTAWTGKQENKKAGDRETGKISGATAHDHIEAP
jgi:hypothetical protein